MEFFNSNDYLIKIITFLSKQFQNLNIVKNTKLKQMFRLKMKFLLTSVHDKKHTSQNQHEYILNIHLDFYNSFIFIF